MRYFKMFQRRNQIFDFVKYDNIPENLFDEATEEKCWITIPEEECILKDPNESMFMKNSRVGLYFFEEKYYMYFRGFGDFVREVFPLRDYPWYMENEFGIDPKSDRPIPCFRASRIRLGPVMTIEEFEDSIDWNEVENVEC